MGLPFAEIFVVFIMSIILLMYLMNHYGEVEYVKSSQDNREYLVRNLDDKQEAADLLSSVTKDLKTLVNHMMAKYPENTDVQQLYKNFNPASISEGSVDSGYTSYSVNKGEKIILCIRQKDQTFVDKNTILYVAIHELGHLMTPEIGHTARFWKNFKFLLEEAIIIGIYVKKDYATNPENYCGIKINNTVL
jgi:predicted metal-dependent hydrolase